MIKKFFMALAVLACATACSSNASKAADAQTNDNNTMTTDLENNVMVEVETTLGNFTLMLYGDTPKHRDNFVKLVNEHFYDGTLFHRVIENFMVQAGDPDSKTARPGQMLGSGDVGYTLEAEINYPKYYHKRGALAAARQGDQVNPERRSSGAQFYVVTGQKLDSAQVKDMKMQLAFGKLAEENLDSIRAMQMRRDRDGLMKLQEKLIAEAEQMVADGKGPMTDEMAEAYINVGGAPHLDGQYTVFGEVVSGMETIDKIEKVETGAADRPKEDVRIISMKILEKS